MTDKFTSEDIKAGWLIDGTGSPAVPNAILKVREGRVASVQSGSDEMAPDDKHPDNVTNLSHCTIIPGLIDAHVHLSMSGTDDKTYREKQLVADYDVIKDVIAGHIRDHFLHGIIAVRDGGDRSAHVLKYKKTIHSRSQCPLVVKTAGRAWHIKGRYGGLVGKPVVDGCLLADSVKKGSDEIDHIKIINSGLNSLCDFGRQTALQFEKRELEEAVSQAGILGLKTMVHANGKIPVKVSIDSGCHSIEHGFFMGAQNLEKMAEKRTVWVPTAYTMKAYAGLFDSKASEPAVPLRNLEHQMEQILMARNFGVKIGLGTDSGSPGVYHGKSFANELKLLMEAGYSVEQAIKCATSNNAELLGLNNLGRLTKGRRATFVVLRGKPLNLPDSLESVESIYIDGRIVYECQK